jgi:uncharacterized membrane protein
MPLDYVQAAARWFGRHPDQLRPSERKALESALQRRPLSENPIQQLEEQATFGQRVADQVARLGGSWTFIGLFMAFLLVWTAVNYSLPDSRSIDPYPFIFLNLLLSMVAALQAPLIMMSQNRQSAKDRRMAAHDYEVNLKAEIEIMALHEKMDAMRTEQLTALLARQQQQLDLLTQLVERGGLAGDGNTRR